MMLPLAYVETTVVSYLTARASRDVIVAGHQQSTHDWWKTCRQDYELCVSDSVLNEAGGGDPIAAQERLLVLNDLLVLETTPEAVVLAKELIRSAALPKKAAEDALHIAIATVWSVEYLLTWNMRHIHNATMRLRIEAICVEMGYKTPIICTPEELGKGMP